MIKFGLIGPKPSVAHIMKSVENKTLDCVLIPHTYNMFSQILDIFNSNRQHWDGVIFTGILGAHFLMHHVEVDDFPVYHIEFDEKHVLAHVIHQLVLQPGLKLTRTYSDIINKANNHMGLGNILDENQLPKTFSLSSFDQIDNSYNIALQDIRELWVNNQLDFVFTAITNILPKLRDMGIPHVHIQHTQESILKTIEHACQSTELFYMKKNSLTVGIIQIAGMTDEQIDFREAEYRDVSLHKALVDFRYKYKWDMSILKLSSGFEITFSQNKLGQLHTSEAFPLLNYLRETLSFEFSVGLGIGRSIDQGRYYSIKALEIAKNFGPCHGFLVNSLNTVSGPLGYDICLHYPLPDDRLRKLAKKINVTPDNLARVIGLWTKMRQPIKSSEIAKSLNITIRSANRIMSSMVQSKIARQLESETVKGKGRPSKTYVIDTKNNW